MASEFECEYCKKILSCKSALKTHERTARYCLALRPEPVQKSETYNCDYCEYTTEFKHCLVRHVKVCKHKLTFEQREEKDIRIKCLLLEQENALIKQQRDEYKLEANKPKKITTNNNLTYNIKQQYYQNILQPINTVLETLSDEIDKRYTSIHFLRGQEGCAQLVSEILNENDKRYITDSNSGDVFIYKDEDAVRTDDKARLIIEASKDPLERTANRECKNKIEEANDLYEDDATTRLKCITKYKSKLQEVKELSSDNLKFRKKMSENAFVSNQTIKTNQECPQDMKKGFALLERIKPKDINLYFTDTKIYQELNKLTNEELELFSDIKGVINFLTEKFLLVNDRLLYKYEQQSDMFIYYEEDQNKLTKKYEKNPTRFKTTFFYIVKKFLITKKQTDLYRYINSLTDEIIRETLVELLTKVDVI